MSVVLVDANAAIMHGRAFPERVRQAVASGTTVMLPQSVKRELVDDVLEAEQAPANHKAAARDIQTLIDEGALVIRAPDFHRVFSQSLQQARRRMSLLTSIQDTRLTEVSRPSHTHNLSFRTPDSKAGEADHK
jgi:hypothetical protein